MEVGRRALDLSIRAVDAYRKTFLVDKVTTDDETPAPASILDEICNILMSCSLELVKEIVEYTFRRLRHRSPLVKTKVLRFIKYSVNKAGSCAYRKELQMHSVTIRELFNHQGDGHPLEGTAPSRDVQDAAQEAIKAIFFSEKSASGNSVRIEGFGSGNFSNMLATSYRSSGGQTLFSGNASENFGYSDNCGILEHHNSNDGFESMQDGQKIVEKKGCHQVDACLIFVSPSCKQEKKEMISTDELSKQIHERELCKGSKKVITPEEKLLNDITAPIGSRLRPSDESLQFFLSRAKAHDASRIAGALKTKLRSSSWKVRLRAVSVLRAILRQQEDGSLLQAIKADEKEFHAFVWECLNFPQETLKREALEALERLSAIKEVNMPGKAINKLMDNPCIQDFLESTPTVDKNRISKSPSAFELQNELVDLLSSGLEALTCGPGGVKNTLPNSAPENSFDIDRMWANDEPLIQTKDLLSEPCVSTQTPMPFETIHRVENAIQSPIMVQFSTGQWKHEMDVQGLEYGTNFAKNITCSGISAPKFIDSEQIQTLSNRNMSGVYDLDALFMHSKGMGDLHTNESWL